MGRAQSHLVGDEGQWKPVNEVTETVNSVAYVTVNTRDVPARQKIKLRITSTLPNGKGHPFCKVGYILFYKSKTNTGTDPGANSSEKHFYQP